MKHLSFVRISRASEVRPIELRARVTLRSGEAAEGRV